MDIFSFDKHGKKGKELCFVALNYRKKQWKLSDESPSIISLETVRTALEEQFPDIYKKLHKRHTKLKAIYAHCKKKRYTPKQELQLPKVGETILAHVEAGKNIKNVV